MPPFSLKVLLTAIGLAVVLTSSADAKSRKQRKPVAAATVATHPHLRGANLFPPGPVMYGTYYLGDDPDPFIRLQLMRDLGAPFGGPD